MSGIFKTRISRVIVPDSKRFHVQTFKGVEVTENGQKFLACFSHIGFRAIVNGDPLAPQITVFGEFERQEA